MTERLGSDQPKKWLRSALSRRRAFFALLWLASAASCFHGEKAPEINPKSTLGLGGQDLSSLPASQQPFGVIFASPQGETSDAPEITVVFNRPMRPLEVAGQEPPAPVTMSPQVPGSWHWVGTQALLFSPEKALPFSTSFVIEVPSGTRAMDGSTLASAYKLTFSTPRPKLVSTTPSDKNEHLEPTSHFTLRFNQPVELAEVQRAVRVLGEHGSNDAYGFSAKYPDPKNFRQVELVPKHPLPRNSALTLEVDPSFRGKEGPLTADRPQRYTYRTYGPLSVLGLSCSEDTPHGNCAPHSGVSIRFSNEIKARDIREAISITPAIPFGGSDSDDYDTDRIYLDAPFAPAREYTIRIKGTLKDQYGQSLGQDKVLKARFDDLWPQAEIGVSGTYFEPSTVRDIAVASVNVKTLELVTAPLDESQLGVFHQDGPGPGFDEIASLAGAKVSRLHPTAAPNLTVKQLVQPKQVLGGPEKRGPMVVAIRYERRPGETDTKQSTQSRVIQVTDLGISAKLSRHGSLIWVTHLSTGKPVDGAEVRIRNPKASGPGEIVGRTDSSGMLAVDSKHFHPRRGDEKAPLIIVRAGNDWAYRVSDDLISSWSMGVSSDMEGTLRLYGMIFSERGIYRPGDTVRLKGIVRQEELRGTSTPAHKAAVLKIMGPDGDTFMQKSVSLSDYGTFNTDIVIPASASLGGYNIEADVQGDDKESQVSGQFEVAEYRPSEFKVSVDLSQKAYIRGDSLRCNAQGSYLFGAPMSQAEVRTTITRQTSYFAPPNTEGFSTRDSSPAQEDDDASPNAGPLQSGTSKLDAKGAISIDQKLAMPGQTQTESVVCEAEVMDLSRQTVSSMGSALVHPGEFYLGVKSGSEDFVQAGQDLSPQVIAVDPAGNHRAGVPVELQLVQRSWVTAKENTRHGGTHSVSRAVDKVLSQCSVSTAQAPTSCKLKVPQAGFFLVRAKAQDKRANPISSSTYIYALGEGNVGWSQSDNNSIELVTDRKSYEVGQTARILVKSPFPQAEALVTVERAGVYTQKYVVLSGSMPTIQVPITEELRPNAYVSVVLVRGRTKAAPAQWNAADVGAPAYRAGYANLLINPEARRLGVSVVSNKTDYRPGDATDVTVQVKDRGGKGVPAEVTLYAVDEGVLMLTDYKTPDPIPVFTQPRELQVGYSEARTDLARLTLSPLAGTVGQDKGLEGGGGGGRARQDFRQSVYFNPSLITDASGQAKASFKLPEGLTTYRIMAVAVAKDDRFGFGDSKVTTSLPLLARPAFPRQLRAGDEFQAGVVVTAKEIGKSSIDVSVNASGITLSEANKKTIELDKGESKEVTFGFRADRVGDAKFVFSVNGGGQSDKVEVSRPVRSPTSLEAVALYGSVTTEGGEKLGDFKDIRTDIGSLDVSGASTALVGLKGSIDLLLEYPYECTEQLTSRLMPLLPLRELSKDFGLELPRNTDAMVASTVGRILRRQRGDGGFAMWDNSPESSPWISAYALWGLGTASRYGVNVPERARESAINYLRSYLAHWDSTPMGPATGAVMVDVLAENGKPDAGYMSTLFEARGKMPLFAKAYLAHALAIGKGNPESLAQLTKEIEAQLRVEGNVAVAAENLGDAYGPLMDSSTRTTALVLRALLAAHPNHPLAANLVRGLLTARQGGQWSNTQESAYALLALDEYRKAQEKQTPDFLASVWLGNDKVLEQLMAERSTQAVHAMVPAAQVQKASGQPLAFQMAGHQKGTLFYEARLRYARQQMPSKPLERGFFVQKAVRSVTPEALQEALRTLPPTGQPLPEPRGGELVLVDLMIVNTQPRDYVVVDDPLAAGIEAIDSSLATTASSLSVPSSGGEQNSEEETDAEEYEDSLARGDAVLSGWYRREVRDDRVVFFVDHMAAGLYHYRYLARATTAGRFLLPPTKAEAMYQPEIFGRTAGTLFIVRPR